MELISSNPGKNYSIRQISQELKKQGIKAHYSRVYAELKSLNNEKTISLLGMGKSRIPKLRLSFETTKKLAQFELEKMNFLDSKEKELLNKIESAYLGRNIDCLALINHKKFKGLNYFELLVILNDSIGGGIRENESLKEAEERWVEEIKKEMEEETKKLFKSNEDKEKAIGAKINPLILLKNKEFIPKLFSNESNALREGFLNHFAFSRTEWFWQAVGIGSISFNKIPEINPFKELSKAEIIYFLRQFGFEIISKEKTTASDKNIGLEYLTAEILSGQEPRFFEGIPIIISKNLEKINFKELLFLVRRKNKINHLGYLLEMTRKALSNQEKIKESDKKKINEIEKALKWLEFFKSEEQESLVEGIKANKKQDETARKWFIKTNYSFKDFQKRMKEYDAI